MIDVKMILMERDSDDIIEVYHTLLPQVPPRGAVVIINWGDARGRVTYSDWYITTPVPRSGAAIHHVTIGLKDMS